MDFSLSPEQETVQEKAPRLGREVKSLSARLDRETRFCACSSPGSCCGVEVLGGGGQGFFRKRPLLPPVSSLTAGGVFRKEALWPNRD
jgi:hypothetical protein